MAAMVRPFLREHLDACSHQLADGTPECIARLFVGWEMRLRLDFVESAAFVATLDHEQPIVALNVLRDAANQEPGSLNKPFHFLLEPYGRCRAIGMQLVEGGARDRLNRLNRHFGSPLRTLYRAVATGTGNALVRAAMHSNSTAIHKGARPIALSMANAVDTNRSANGR